MLMYLKRYITCMYMYTYRLQWVTGTKNIDILSFGVFIRPYPPLGAKNIRGLARRRYSYRAGDRHLLGASYYESPTCTGTSRSSYMYMYKLAIAPHRSEWRRRSAQQDKCARETFELQDV